MLHDAQKRLRYRSFGGCGGRLILTEKKARRPFSRFRVQDLRHRFAIRWLRNGGGIYELSKHLGHTSLKIPEVYLAYLSAQEQTRVQMGGQQVVGEAKKVVENIVLSIP